jgi:hypothetical protein
MISLIIGAMNLLLSFLAGFVIFRYDFNPIVMFILTALLAITGLAFFIYGFKEVYKDSRTHLSGVDTYGFVIYVDKSIAKIGDEHILQATAAVVTHQKGKNKNLLGEIKIVEEDIGLAPARFAVGDYVKVKYCKGDINFVSKVSVDDVPEEYLHKLEPFKLDHKYAELPTEKEDDEGTYF